MSPSLSFSSMEKLLLFRLMFFLSKQTHAIEESRFSFHDFWRAWTSGESGTYENDSTQLDHYHYYHRHLNETRGQAVLTFMYLCVLGLCFMTAVVYFCRMQWEERYLRRLRESELHAMRAAMAQSEAALSSTTHHHRDEESRAVQRKYIEERRARILQLFGPVRMTLMEEDFHLDEEEMQCNTANQPTTGDGNDETNDIEANKKDALNNGRDLAPEENVYGDEDSLLVELPTPGLHLALGANEKPPTRLVSGMCTICLCTFEVGADVVWSSNELCEHVFHQACIEKWLMKQREGPLCPCCRRDFIVDPYDLELEQSSNNQNNTSLANIHAVAAENPRATRIQNIFWQGVDDDLEVGIAEA